MMRFVLSSIFVVCVLYPAAVEANYHYKHARSPVDVEELLARARRAVVCDPNEKYRSVDGTCNNLGNPKWGSAGQTFARRLSPIYDDGKFVPRMKSKIAGEYIPFCREISVTVHEFGTPKLHPSGTLFLMQWGQFLAHDITLSPLDKRNITDFDSCCYDNGTLVSETHMHPDVLSGGPCHPLIIPPGDRYFTKVPCIDFIRTLSVKDANGVRQQINELSAYIDGSQVYGGSEQRMNELRKFQGGKLLSKGSDDLLEADSNTQCVKSDKDDYCLKAGDDKVNDFPALGATHTVFHRYHNYVAKKLASAHPDYDDETLFQETRRIVIAVIQRITFNEYLPEILADETLTKYGLDAPWSYDATCDATISNVFSTAAFRFGHSMMPETVKVDDEDIPLVDMWSNPHLVEHKLDSLLKAIASDRSEQADRYYAKGFTDQLFETRPQNGYDIATRNVQRGRDHGLRPFNDWREMCGLPRHTNLLQLTDTDAFDRVYKHVDDVDAYSGGVCEHHMAGSSLGPTFNCLLGMEFQKLRNCDRFWFENTDNNIGFTQSQIAEIKKIRLSDLICLTTDVKNIQGNVMNIANNGSNPVQSCKKLLESSADYSIF